MSLLKKAAKLWRSGGAASLWYIIREKLKNKASEQQKYEAYLRNEKKRVRSCCARPSDCKRIQIELLETGAQVFSAIEEARAPYVAFLEEGAVVSADWQQQVTAYLERHPQIRLLYTDEDCMDGHKRCRPSFKPDWAPDTYLSYDYIGGLIVMERTLANKAKEQIHSKYRESFLYELGLRATGMLSPDRIGHLDVVLYHRTTEKEVPKEQQLALKETILHERMLTHTMQGYAYPVWSEEARCAMVAYELPKEPLVSIVVPSRDHAKLLRTCLRSVEAHTAYERAEWIVVDNGSAPEQKKQYEALCADTRYPCRYLYEPMEFNFSRMCNIGAAHASGEYLLFFNDDMELPESLPVLHDGAEASQRRWLHVLVGQAAQPHTGAVGAKLLYPDSDLIQHLGIVNYTSGAAHLLWQASDAARQPYDRNLIPHNYAAVTGACLMISADKFARAGGFDETLAVTFNDVELCLKLLEAGYYNVVRSDVVLYHHESLSRGQDVLDEKKFLRGLKERERLFDLHPAGIGVDPFYSRHLTQTRLDHTMDYPQRLVYAKRIKRKENLQEAATGRCKTAMHENAGVQNASAAQNAACSIAARILRVRCEEELLIEGWAYRPGHHSERVTVHLIDEDGNDTAYTTQAVYDPTLAKEQQRSEKLDFSAFILRLPAKDLKKGSYQIALQLGTDICGLQRGFCISTQS